MTDRFPVQVKLATEALGVFKVLKAARHNVLEIIPKLATQQPMVSGKSAMVSWHMVMDPATLREVLLEKLDIYPKSNVTKYLLEAAVGDSMFVAEGAHWRWQRRAASPVFSHRNVQNLSPIMTHAANLSVERLTKQAGGEVDVFEEMVATTFDVISDVTFSGGDNVNQAVIHDAIEQYIDQAARVSLFDILGLPGWVPRPSRMLAGRTLRKTKQLTDDAIEKRRKSGPREIPDLLDLLMDGEDPKSKRQMTTSELRDNLLTFIVAGHETTALTLAWALYLCAFDTDVQDKARDEAQAVLGDRTAKVEDVANLPYVRMIVDEALRLYPPAAFLSRTAQQDDVLMDREIKAKDTVMLPIYALHRNELLWDDPDAFKPERFEDPKSIDRYAYLPFGNGPRVCIGAQFALQEAVIILSTLLAKFRFTAIPGKEPEPVMVLTLRPKGGLHLQVDPV